MSDCTRRIWRFENHLVKCQRTLHRAHYSLVELVNQLVISSMNDRLRFVAEFRPKRSANGPHAAEMWRLNVTLRPNNRASPGSRAVPNLGENLNTRVQVAPTNREGLLIRAIEHVQMLGKVAFELVYRHAVKVCFAMPGISKAVL